MTIPSRHRRPRLPFWQMVMVASASIFLAPAALACTQSAAEQWAQSIQEERSTKIQVTGFFEELERGEITTNENDVPTQEIRGRIVTETGDIYLTRHNGEAVIYLCPHPILPNNWSYGTFFIDPEQVEGRYEIYDWRGNHNSFRPARLDELLAKAVD